MHARRRIGPRGFTLVELLVVIAIIALISAIALPTVLSGLNERRVSESARVLQAILAGTRDTAIRANAPRGIRLLPDPILNGLSPNPNAPPNPLASNRVIPIEPGPDYTEGLVRVPTLYFPNLSSSVLDPTFSVSKPGPSPYTYDPYLRIAESGYTTGSTVGANVPNNPTSWFNNVRQGDKIRFNDSGAYYTIIGPVDGLPATSNPERFIVGKVQGAANAPIFSLANWAPEYLFLANGKDDNGNGWIDESCDGIDNDNDGITDPGFNGIDDDGMNGIDDPAELYLGVNLGNGIYSGTEYEQEVFLGSQATSPPNNEAYTIFRRPVVSPGARETTLPAGVVIDLTTWNSPSAPPASQANQTVLLPERSRLPVDGYTYYVDIMIDQSGRVITPGAGMDGGGYYGNSPLANLPFYHFWLTEREDVLLPIFGTQLVGKSQYNVPVRNAGYVNVLPMPQHTTDSSGTVTYTPPPGLPKPYLTGERRLVTLFVKTGQIVSNSIQYFDPTDINRPYYDAQAGIKESQ